MNRTILFLGLTALISGTSASGAIVFSEDFGTIGNGTVLTDSNTGYDSVRNNNFDAVSLNPSTIGSGSSMSYGGATSTSNENFYVDYGEGALSVTTTQFTLKGSDLASGDWYYLEGGSGDSNTMFSNSGFAAAELFWAIRSNNGVLEYRNSSDDWSTSNLAFSLSDGVTYDFHIVANRSGSTVNYGASSVANNAIDIYINGTIRGDDLGVVSNRDSIGMKVYQVSGGTAFEFDDHVVYDEAVAVPEPSTYAAILGALGIGLVMIRRRRR